MDIKQIKSLYKANEIKGYKLKDTEDLYKIHGVDFKTVKGYNELNEVNKEIFKNFIVNIFNSFTVESRSTLVSNGVYYVEDTQCFVKENSENPTLTLCSRTVKEIGNDDKKNLLHRWEDEECKNLEVVKSNVSTYLRFEYDHNGSSKWLQIMGGGKSWY